MVTGITGACGKTKRIGVSGNSSSLTTGTKSLPSAPSPCIQMMLVCGFGAVSISMVCNWDMMRARFYGLSLARSLRRFGTERLDHRVVRFDVRAADEIDAIGHRREDAVDEQIAVGIAGAFQRFADCLGLARQIEDQRILAHHADL